MKKYILLLLSLFLLGGTAVKGQGSSINSSLLPNDSVPALPWPQSLQADIDTLLATSALLDVSEVGLIVYDLSADSALYSYRPRHTLRPASNMKLVTSIAALDRLGGAHKFRTSLYYTGVLDSCTLRGSLYCVGGMDPKFDDDDLQVFAMQVRSLGIDTIRGRIVADK